jgi:hypothetical protein
MDWCIKGEEGGRERERGRVRGKGEGGNWEEGRGKMGE